MEKSAMSFNVGFTGLFLLTLIFITLKLTNIINWSWLWVLAPIWIAWAIGFVFLFVYVIVVVFVKSKK